MPGLTIKQVLLAYFRGLVDQAGRGGESSQRAFAERTKIKRQNVEAVYNGKRGVTIAHLQKIADAYGLSAGDLLYQLAGVALRGRDARGSTAVDALPEHGDGLLAPGVARALGAPEQTAQPRPRRRRK